jgi:hypothetical protein
LENKNIKIWNIIGPSICHYYMIEKQININFMKADKDSKYTMSNQSTLYILMLDKSYSMTENDSTSSSRWESLKYAVESFIKKIE